MAELNTCMRLIARMSQADQDDLVERVDAYIASGLPPQSAQTMAIADMIAELEREATEIRELAQAQRPTPAPAAGSDPAPAEPEAPPAPPSRVPELASRVAQAKANGGTAEYWLGRVRAAAREQGITEAELAQDGVLDRVEALAPRLSKAEALAALRGEVARAAQPEAPALSAREQTDTEEFKAWFGRSTIVNEDGSPKVMYHGTARDITAFRAKQAGSIFVTPRPNFASDFSELSIQWMVENIDQVLGKEEAKRVKDEARQMLVTLKGEQWVKDEEASGDPLWASNQRYREALVAAMPSGPNVLPLYVKAERPFDPDNEAVRKRVIRQLLLDRGVTNAQGRTSIADEDGKPTPWDARTMDGTLTAILSNWSLIEQPWFQEALREMGFDSYYVKEGGVKNLAVYKPTQLKSAVGNSGAFDPNNPDIRYSTREELTNYLAGRNKTLSRVNPASVLESDISKAAQAIDIAKRETAGGKYESLEVPIGPVPHVLHMMGAPMQMMKVDTSIVYKLLNDPQKHRELLRPFTARQLVEALYNPAMVLRDPKERGTYRVVTDLPGAKAPLTFVVMTNALTAGGKTKVTAIKSLYDRLIVSADPRADTLLKSVLTGDVLYADVEKAQRAINDFRAQFRRSPARQASGKNVPQEDTDPIDSAWKSIRDVLLDGVGRKSIKTDLDLIRFIGNNYRADERKDGWEDAPSFSQRQPQSPGWSATLPAPSRLERVVYELQDKQVDLKKVTAAVRETAGQLNDRQDAYLREELYHGRVADRTQAFLNNELQPLLVELRAAGVKLEDFEQYLHARHAKERNAAMMAINRDRPDNDALSGMSDALADTILANAPPVLAKLAARVDAMTEGTRTLMEVSGLETAETVNALRNAYQFYVPLKRDDLHPDDREMTGSGFNMRGSNLKRAVGSTARVTNILSHIVEQREAAIVRAEKNLVGMALYSMALKAPDPAFWRADMVPTVRRIDERQSIFNPGLGAMMPNPNYGQVVEMADTNYKLRPEVLTIKVNGEDRVIVFNDRNERAARMAQALKNLDAEPLNGLMRIVGKGTRWLASVNTQYNPVFTIVNGLRDLQGAVVNLGSTPLRGMEAKLVGDAFRHGYATGWRVARDPRAGGAWADLYRELSARGGLTGWRDSYTGISERAEALQGAIRQLDEGVPMRAGRAIVGVVSDLNLAVENGIRLAAYKAGLDRGLTKDQAASIAKNLTVNFNRKGRLGGQIGALYAFFNAAVQGTARLADVVKGPTGKRVIAGGLLLGVLQAALLRSMDDEDEEAVPDWQRERNFIIPVGDKLVMIPMPLGLHVIPNVGRHVADAAFAVYDGQPIDGWRRFVGLATTFLDAFNPIGGAADPAQMIAPTVVDPLIQLGQNKDFGGNPIFRERSEFTQWKSGDSLGRDSTNPAYKLAASAINRITGGEGGVRNIELQGTLGSVASPQPEALRFLVETVGGGVWRESEKLLESLIAAADPGADAEPHRLPLLGRFYGDLSTPQAPMSAFYERLGKVEAARQALKRAEDAGADVDAIYDRRPEVALADRAGQIRREIAELREQRRTMQIEGSTDIELKEMDEAIATLMRDFNAEYREATRREPATAP
ncbi:hypothetical protein UFOVP707_59 [uncultured Caudovirales phage]|uniref:Large polyvalent protein associated domain-containing protein n=1 Tax=uncultured Caudovirales phage TaxID=2100421 RepID=A0A6J5NJZ4_9CAUD|nr:hypothetical protein UFOVP707_59 [uncultured Caudovirales phage]